MARRMIVPGVHIEEEQNNNIPKNLVQEQRIKAKNETSEEESDSKNFRNEAVETETEGSTNDKKENSVAKKHSEKIVSKSDGITTDKVTSKNSSTRNTSKKVNIKNKKAGAKSELPNNNTKAIATQKSNTNSIEKKTLKKSATKSQKKIKIPSTNKIEKVEKQKKLVIVGEATKGGWNIQEGQQFTQISENKFEITIYLKANKEYLILPHYQDWTHKWATSNQANVWQGVLDIQGSGNNFKVPDKTGNYKIELDFSRPKAVYRLIKILV